MSRTPSRPSDFHNADGHFVPMLLGRHLAAETPVRVGPDGGSLWTYSGGVYREDRTNSIGRRIRARLGDKWRPHKANATLKWLAGEERIDLDSVDDRLVNVANGMLDWRTVELRPHSPEYGSTIQSPWRWNPEADCPRFRQAFAHLPPGVLDLVFEIAGYMLLPSDPLKKAVLLYGPADTGKSTLLDCLRSLVGTENCSATSLQALADERFARANLYGKAANICGDLDARAVRSSDTFKKATGGDPIEAERKGRDHFTFVNRATLLFSANELPHTQDQSDAWFKRFLIIPMTTPVEKVDPSLKRDLPRSQQEMEGLLRHAVEGLRRLMERGRFDPPAAVVDAGLAYRDEADSVRSFFRDDRWQCTGSDSDALGRKDIYAEYREWCQQNGRLPVKNSTFYGRIKKDGAGLGLRLGSRKSPSGSPVRVIRGLRRSGAPLPGRL